jgi:hypothetical protein
MKFKTQINSIKSRKVRIRIKEEAKDRVLSNQSYIRNQKIYLMRFKVCKKSKIMYLISILLNQKIIIQSLSIKSIVSIIRRKLL